MSYRLENARIVDASGVRNGGVTIDDGRITDGAADKVYDMGGLTLFPALIDMHTHLRDPGWPQKETLQSGMTAAVAGGFGTLCAMANTDPVCETPEQVLANHERAEALGLCRLMQAAAAGKGLGDELPTDRAALCNVTRVLTNDGKTIFRDDFMEQLLKDSARYGFIISTHCQPERQTVKRDIELLRRVGGNLHVGHISRAETVAIIRQAKADGLKLTCEVTPHHLIGCDSDYKVNPPLRTKADTEALIEGIADGTIDCLATDHAPHTPADKAAGMAGISNIDYALGVWLRVFYENGIPLPRFAEMSSCNPNKLLGLGAGCMAPGQPADIIAVNTEETYTLDCRNMRSRSRNTPFEGQPLRGRVILTIIGGKPVYDNGQIMR